MQDRSTLAEPTDGVLINWTISCDPSRYQFSCLTFCQANFNMSFLFSTTNEPYDTDKMAMDFVAQFMKRPFTSNQQAVYQFENKKMLSVLVTEIEGR